MLREVADGVWVRQSGFSQTNATVIRGEQGVLLVDPGVVGKDLEELAGELERMGLPVAAGFSTHPHWDHLLWHPRFGQAPRYATARGAAAVKGSLERSRRLAAEQAPGAPLDVLGMVKALPAGAVEIPWQGPALHLVEHEAHATGHAAVVIPSRDVLLAADMLSDVEIPLLDAHLPDQVAAYSTALDRLEAALTPGISVLVPGHGAVARGEEIAERLRADRSYIEALQRGQEPADRRLGPGATYGRGWLPDAHRQNLRLAGITS